MHRVKILIADAERIAARADEIIGGIPEYYAMGYRRIRRRREAAQELAAGYLLQKYLGISRDAQILRGPYGKPVPAKGGRFFSLSHSGAYTALAIASIDIGMDMEQIMDVHWPTVGKVFPQGAREQLELTPGQQKPRLFTRMWTELEAVLKLKGTGIAAGVEAGGDESGYESGSGRGDIFGPARFLRSVEYGDYMISCAAWEKFEVCIEEIL